MKNIFEDLFVLEMANNHWGSVDRGLAIISAYAKVARFNNVRAAIKLQFRDVASFIHQAHLGSDERYIKKTLATALTEREFGVLVNAVRMSSMVTMATPFDETSVEWCRDLDIIKIASSDINDWFLIEAIARLRKPVLVSTAGSSLKDIDDLVLFFEHRNIPLGINHCVALYPTEDEDMDLNQIDFLRDRYPGHVIGLSTHECHDWTSSMFIAYSKGARTFERHVDIMSEKPVSMYCSLPDQIDQWFKAWHKAKEMCGAPGTSKRIPRQEEIRYLDKLVRGAYAKRDLAPGEMLVADDVYLSIPLLSGQVSCRELLLGEWGHRMATAVPKDGAVMIENVETPYSSRVQGTGFRVQGSGN